ncbi:MAG: hypothetical protein OYM47_20100 [Gemmatimonadota bacterium]|nr:hypothetical protein [Gemmatimonadota bacterium]
MAEDKARNRVPSSDSARARNAVFRPQGPAAARMGFFNGLLGHGQSLKAVKRDIWERNAILSMDLAEPLDPKVLAPEWTMNRNAVAFSLSGTDKGFSSFLA